MKTKLLSSLFCIISVLIIAFDLTPDLQSNCAEYTVGEAESLADGIVSYRLKNAGADSVQDWINGELTNGAGTVSEWNILTLSQSGYDKCSYSSYESALLDYLSSAKAITPTSREKYALALCAAGSNSPYITNTISDSAGEQGIMSWIYALHILNNGYTCPKHSIGSVCDELLSLQLSDGGWALWGENGDIDVTAMTIQSLAPSYDSDSDVRAAVDKAIAFLSRKQESDGGYVSFGTANPESAAQVLVALSALDIDCQTDSRFIKDGCNVIDGIVKFRLPDGSFSHILNGPQNNSATNQAHYAIVSYLRMKQGKSPLLVLDNRANKPAVQLETSEPHTESIVHTQETTYHNSGVLQDTVDTSSETQSSTAQTADTTAAGTVHTDIPSVYEQTTTLSVTVTTIESSTVSGNTTTTTYAVSGLETLSSTTTGEVIASASEVSSTGSKKGGYKTVAIIIILCAGSVLCLVIFAMGKRNYKNFIAVGTGAALMIVFVLVTNFQSTKDYYNGEKIHKEDAIGTVTLSIRCDTIAGKSDSDYIPDDGIILDETEFDLEDGETVFDILTEASRTYRIQVENKGSAGGAHGMVYIAGINYIYEMDFGDLSGWVYHVNGITPSRGCGEYVLEPGDRIEWLYTCELGHDLDEVYEK